MALQTVPEINEDQKIVFEKATKGHNIFLTGGAGVGKSFVISNIIEYFVNNNILVGTCAMTGTAAILINGTTLHSFMGIGLATGTVETLIGKITKNKKTLNKLKNLEVLIIDEVSMLNDELFDKISEILKIIRYSQKPFGGLQIILVGDPFQLSPISGEYCFLSKHWDEFKFEVVLLTKNMRVTDDIDFKEMLDRLRWGKCCIEDLIVLKTLKNTKFPDYIVPTRLFSRNADVDLINNTELKKLTDSGAKLVEYSVNYPNAKKKVQSKEYVRNIKLITQVELCVGAQIIITRNIDILSGLVNGTRGIITDTNSFGITIKLVNGTSVVIDFFVVIPEDTFGVEFSYLPIKLAWAISIHASQGMTLDALEVDLGSKIFACGQAYTGLSRVRSLDSVRVLEVSNKSFKTSPKVISFYSKLIK